MQVSEVMYVGLQTFEIRARREVRPLIRHQFAGFSNVAMNFLAAEGRHQRHLPTIPNTNDDGV